MCGAISAERSHSSLMSSFFKMIVQMSIETMKLKPHLLKNTSHFDATLKEHASCLRVVYKKQGVIADARDLHYTHACMAQQAHLVPLAQQNNGGRLLIQAREGFPKGLLRAYSRAHFILRMDLSRLLDH